MENFKELLIIILDLKYSTFIKKKSCICINNKCNKHACFNYKNKKKRLYCNTHKLKNMININDIKRSCIISDCYTRAIYNYKNNKCGIYCNKHKLKNMINITSKTCQNLNCNKLPIFNYNNTKKGLFCKDHKLENMIDIINKKCIIKDCNIRSNYNYKNKKAPLYCKIHKLKNMIDILHKKCQYKNCNTRPIFNYNNTKKGLFCKEHKLENMIDVVNISLYCKLCNLVRTEKQFEYLCSNCFYFKYPNHKKTRNHKSKENIIITDLNKILNNKIIQDKIIINGCSKRRPDGLIKLNDYNIIIEIDENQHLNYSCENKRLMEIFKDLGKSPLTIIRFNPDKYILENKIIKSPFGITKSDGKLKIINKKEYNIRIQKLIEVINININLIPDKEINIIKLFYDTIN